MPDLKWPNPAGEPRKPGAVVNPVSQQDNDYQECHDVTEHIICCPDSDVKHTAYRAGLLFRFEYVIL